MFCNCLRLFLTSHEASVQKSNFQLSVRFRFQWVHSLNFGGYPPYIGSNFPSIDSSHSYRPKLELLRIPAIHLHPTSHFHSTTRTPPGPTPLTFH